MFNNSNHFTASYDPSIRKCKKRNDKAALQVHVRIHLEYLSIFKLAGREKLKHSLCNQNLRHVTITVYLGGKMTMSTNYLNYREPLSQQQKMMNHVIILLSFKMPSAKEWGS